MIEARGTLGGGAASSCTSFFYNGILDEPAIYNRALASNEIAAMARSWATASADWW